MFCYQCEQTVNCTGCTTAGVCGKDAQTADLQDFLIYATEGVSMWLHQANQVGATSEKINRYLIENLFTTVTNVNFDVTRIFDRIQQTKSLRAEAKALYLQAVSQKNETLVTLDGPAVAIIPSTQLECQTMAATIGVEHEKETFGDDVAGLRDMLLFGLKGMAAYADHAAILGQRDDDVEVFFNEALSFLGKGEHTVDDLLAMLLKAGEVNIRVMELLDLGNTGTYGHPEPTAVRVTPVKGKAILVSGHDLKDLEALLQQTEGRNINVYTHGEMLPCHGYPELKKYKHLVGNYGGAWQDQQKEFDAFPGSILMTTNCIQKPKDSYKGRIFTCGLVAWPDVCHISDRNFAPVIEMALSQDGFTEDAEEKTITVGFGRNAVMSVAGTVIDAVKAGDIRHFFLVGGCDGAKSGRNYYTELAEKIPEDCVILTLACGKYRFNKKDFGDIGGIPRLLDIGQCNDAYSAVKIAQALAGAFDCGVNDLPLSLVLSWYEQKAVCILLSLLYLGINNIRLGPTLPAFVTEPVLKVLVEKFNIQPITTPDDDLKAMLG